MHSYVMTAALAEQHREHLLGEAETYRRGRQAREGAHHDARISGRLVRAWAHALRRAARPASAGAAALSGCPGSRG